MSTPASAIKPLHALRVLQPASGALLEQLGLYTRLLTVEWALEKRRLSRLLAAGLLSLAFLLCLLLAGGASLVAWYWSTPYRMTALGAVLGVYLLGAVLAWGSLLALIARGAGSFSATRSAFAADMELLRSKL
jgi:uncharacterized membrane protein YqjE